MKKIYVFVIDGEREGGRVCKREDIYLYSGQSDEGVQVEIYLVLYEIRVHVLLLQGPGLLAHGEGNVQHVFTLDLGHNKIS